VATLGEGQFFGEMSLMTGESRTATIVATSHVDCFIVDKHAFQEIIEDKPELAATISEILTRRQQELSAEVSAAVPVHRQTKQQLMTRIASFFGLGTDS
jgi:CRP-like cAMP-binding protein